MRKELLQILQHSLGLDQYGQGVQYRNYFAAGEDDAKKCRELVSFGYMTEYPARKGFCGVPFVVTKDGINYVRSHSPKEPKLTRSQRRYRHYRSVADWFENFGEYLKSDICL